MAKWYETPRGAASRLGLSLSSLERWCMRHDTAVWAHLPGERASPKDGVVTRARTPAETVDALLTLRARVEAQIRSTLARINAEPARKRSRFVVPDCGTESAFQRHHHFGEPIDEPCRDAHRLHERVRYARETYGDASCG